MKILEGFMQSKIRVTLYAGITLVLIGALPSVSLAGGSCLNPSFHVDDRFGNDGNSGSRFRPFKTIQRGVDAAANRSGRDLVMIRPGHYVENVFINDGSGALTLCGSFWLPWGGVVVNGSDSGPAIGGVLEHDVTIKYLKATNGAGGGIDFQDGGSDLTLWKVRM